MPNSPFSSDEIRDITLKIAHGHAYFKHVLGRKEFAGNLTHEQFGLLIETPMRNSTKTRSINCGRIAYWYKAEGMIVIVDPRHQDRGTAYIPDQGYLAFKGRQP